MPDDAALPDGRTGKLFRGPIAGDGDWQMVPLRDIGAFARLMLDDPDKWGGRTLRIASDQMPMARIAATFEDVTGIPAAYDPMSEAEFLNSGLPHAHDPLNNMLIYRDGHFEPRDFDELRRMHPDLCDFRTWLKSTGWRGEPRAMRKNAATGDGG